MLIKLKKPHAHAGRTYPPGATLSGLRPDQAEWLIAIGVAEAAPEPLAEAIAKPTVKAKE